MRQTKIFSMFLVGALALSLVACGGKRTPTTSAPGASKETVKISLNHVGATSHPYNAGSEKFAELVSKKSGGSVTVEVFPASQIASGAKAVELVQMGTLDIALESTMSAENFIPEIGVLNLPFLFKNQVEAFKVLDGKVGDELKALAEKKGFKILAWWANGFRDVSNSVRPITAPGDLKGLKIRVPESQVFLKTFQQLGAIPTPMAISEVFSAMQLHAVDGQENPTAVFVNNKYAEVNKYYSVTQHIFTAEPLIMSLNKFNSLSAEQQKAVQEAANEAAVFERDLISKSVEKDLQDIKAGGAIVNVVEDMSPFQAAVQPVYEGFKKQYGDLIDKIKSAK